MWVTCIHGTNHLSSLLRDKLDLSFHPLRYGREAVVRARSFSLLPTAQEIVTNYWDELEVLLLPHRSQSTAALWDSSVLSALRRRHVSAVGHGRPGRPHAQWTRSAKRHSCPECVHRALWDQPELCFKNFSQSIIMIGTLLLSFSHLGSWEGAGRRKRVGWGWCVKAQGRQCKQTEWPILC